MSSQHLAHFGEVFQRRRLELGLTQEAVQAASGPSPRRQAQIERGKGPAPSVWTLAKIDKALQWVPGSAERVLSGGRPEPAAARPVAEVDLDRLEQALERAGILSVRARGGENRSADGSAIAALIDALESLARERERD